MRDADLAALYGVWTKRLNEAVKRNLRRFPGDFSFRLTAQETDNLRSQMATSSSAFVQLRGMLVAHADLARKLAELERKYDAQFRAVFDAIRELMEPPPPPERKRMGFPL
jgi:hypothetical protein